VPVMVMRKGRGKSACVCTTVLGNAMAVIDVHTHTHILTNTDLGGQLCARAYSLGLHTYMTVKTKLSNVQYERKIPAARNPVPYSRANLGKSLLL